MPGKCSFQDRWLQDKDFKTWVLRDPVDKTKAKCGVCATSLNIANMGEAALKVHMKSDWHKKNAKRHNADTRIVMSDFFRSDQSEPSGAAPADCTIIDSSSHAQCTLPTSTTRTTQQSLKEREEKRRKKKEKLMRQWEAEKQQKEEELATAKEKEDEEERAQLLGRHYTVSIALSGSILDNAQSRELRSYLAGQIARAAVVFNVDEIVVFDETNSLSSDGTVEDQTKQGCLQLQMILEYLECPQYLRKAMFKRHGFLNYAGLLNPLDSPHHMRATDDCPFREGVVLNKPVREDRGSYADVGLYKEIQLDKQIKSGVRVTVKMGKNTGGKRSRGQVVTSHTPREEQGLYWGYTVRLARSLGQVITECPYEHGYDLTIGTSERGDLVDSLQLPEFRHLLVVFGGVQGLEASLESDPCLDEDDPSLLFHHYVNTCPNQGSRTIRTEEAILITMSALRPKISEAVAASRTNGQS